MRENDGRKLDHKTLEALRLRAVDQVRHGARAEDVAVALGLHRKTVYAWLKKYREGGRDALLARPVPGRPPRLGEQQVRELSTLLTGTDPRQFDFELALWTADMVREVIQRKFGITLSSVSVSRQLGKMGMVPQRPLRRAYQQDPEAASQWHEQVYPRIAASAVAAGATIYFADEAGVKEENVNAVGVNAVGVNEVAQAAARPPQEAGHQPGPRAQQTHPRQQRAQPVRQRRLAVRAGNRYRLNMISAVTAKGGAQRFAVFDASAHTALCFTEFCARLIHDAPGPVYLIVDGHPVHRAQAVTEYAASTCGKLELFYLPVGL
jgi:transposase